MLDSKTKLETQRRRHRLMAAIGPDALAIVQSGNEKVRNSDVHYLFRPNSDFVYLTGFHEPDSVLVIAPGYPKGEVSLFVRPRDMHAEQWNGRRLGAERVSDALGIENAYTIDEFDKVLPQLLDSREALHVENGDDSATLDSWQDKTKAAGVRPPKETYSLENTLHEIRLIKSSFEIEMMQKAAKISSGAHKRAMRFCEPGVSELDLERELQHEFAKYGARFTAYPSIVASGENACIMHYIENNARIDDGDLVLIDAGCEYECYASDITRTFPANGKFTPEQRDVYDIVLDANREAIDEVQTGKGFSDPHNKAAQVLTQGLIDIGVLSGSLEENLESDSAKPFTVHRCSHFLGLDVHDVGKRVIDGKDRTLEPDMVLTVEPGLYFGSFESMPAMDDRWKGIGIRIEDDVLVTENGNRVLTSDVAKNASDIEALVNA